MSDDTTLRSADAELTLSEERLRVGTRTTVIGRAVLRRRIVTEQRTVTFEVRREVAELEVLPPDGVEDDAARGAHLALPELVLHEEQVVITRRIVPVERVRLRITPVTEQQQVVETVRREQAELSGDAGPS